MYACGKGNLKIAEVLVNNGADVNAKSNKGTTSLMLACYMNHLPIVEFLLDKGANIGDKNIEEQTALGIAVDKKNEEIVKLLLSKGAFNYIPGENINEKIKDILDKWPPTMVIVLLDELKVMGLIDPQTVIDLKEYIGGKRKKKKSIKKKKKTIKKKSMKRRK
jgi:ankyrin repeat protein